MTDHRAEPAWLAALTSSGNLTFLDVSSLVGDGRGGVRAAIAHRAGGYIDRVRVATAQGPLLVYFPEPRWRIQQLAHNRHAEKLFVWSFGIDIGVYRGTFLILGERDNHEVGLTEPQTRMLRAFLDTNPATVSQDATVPTELDRIS